MDVCTGSAKHDNAGRQEWPDRQTEHGECIECCCCATRLLTKWCHRTADLGRQMESTVAVEVQGHPRVALGLSWSGCFAAGQSRTQRPFHPEPIAEPMGGTSAWWWPATTGRLWFGRILPTHRKYDVAYLCLLWALTCCTVYLRSSMRSLPARIPEMEVSSKLNKGKKCLALDLDETLVHSSFQVPSLICSREAVVSSLRVVVAASGERQLRDLGGDRGHRAQRVRHEEARYVQHPLLPLLPL